MPSSYLPQFVSTVSGFERRFKLPKYSLGMRYQFCLKAVMISLLFSSGLPAILFVAALSLLLVYWIDKHNGALPVNRLLHAMPCHAMPCHAMPCHGMVRAVLHRSCLHIGCRTSHAWSMS